MRHELPIPEAAPQSASSSGSIHRHGEPAPARGTTARYRSQRMDAVRTPSLNIVRELNDLLTPIIWTMKMLRRSGAGTAREREWIAQALLRAERAKTLARDGVAYDCVRLGRSAR